MKRSCLPPSPSWPRLLRPKETTRSDEVRSRVWRAPQAALTNRRGLSDDTAVGVEAVDATPADLAAAEIRPEGGISFESDD